MALLPNTPVVNLGELYVSGMNIAFGSATTITVDAGQVRDSTDLNDIVLSSGVTINAALNGVVNGLDFGALANSTLYSVYAIADSKSYQPTGCLLSASATQPTLPFGYDMFRRIGAVRTSGAAAILDFSQAGKSHDRTYWYAAAIATAVVAGGPAAFAAVDISSSVPVTAQSVIMKAVFTAAAAAQTVALREPGSSSVLGQDVISADAAVVHTAMMRSPVATVLGVQSVEWAVVGVGGAVALSVQGYVDSI